MKTHIYLAPFLFLFLSTLCLYLGFSITYSIAYGLIPSILFPLGCIFLQYNKTISTEILYTLFVGILYMSFFSVLSFYYSVYFKGTPSDPFFLADDGSYHSQALYLAKSENWTESISSTASNGIAIEGQGTNYIGYQLVLGFFYKFLYQDLIVGLLLNLTIGFLNLLLFALLLKKIFLSNKIVFNGLILMVLSPHICSSSVILLKDVFIIMSLLLLLILLCTKWRATSILLFIPAILIIFTMRAQFIVVLPILALIKYGFKMKLMIYMLFSVFLIQNLSQYTSSVSSNSITLSEIESATLSNSTVNEWKTSSKSVVNVLVSGYTDLPVPARILRLPLPVFIQYITPVDFWTLDIEYPSLIVERNLNIIWFLFLGPLTIFSMFQLKKIENALVVRIGMIGLFLFLSLAFIYAGVIPRYFKPFMPMFLIVATAGWHYLQNSVKGKTLWRFFVFGYFGILTFGFISYLIFKV